jgi:hypothetical protein
MKVKFSGMIIVSTVVDSPSRGSEPTIVKGYVTPFVGSVKLELQCGTVRGLREDALPWSEESEESDEETEFSSARVAANAPAAGSRAVAVSARQASAHATDSFLAFTA